MAGHSQDAAGRGRILVADDNRLIQVGLSEILRRLGFDSKVVSDGRSALEELRSGGYEMLFVDRQMPLMSGIECTREIRRKEKNESPHRLPVVVITGDPRTEVLDECLMAGADEVLTKPFTVEKLSGVLKRFLPGGDPSPGSDRPLGKSGREPDGRQQPRPVSVNTERIDEIRRLEDDGAADLLKRMVELYRAGSAKLIEEIRQALRDGNARALADAAHELKSSSGSVGGERLWTLSADMERLGRLGLLDGAEGIFSLMEAEQEVLLGVLSKELSSGK